MHIVERVIRRVAMGIIGIFLVAFVAFVIGTLIEDGGLLLRFYGASRLLQILLGPVTAFVALIVVIRRTGRDADAGSSRRSFRALAAFGAAIVSVFRLYGAKYGRDAWVILFLISGTWSLVLLWIVAPRGGPGSGCPDCGSIRLPYLLFMTALWSILAISVWRAAGAAPRIGSDREAGSDGGTEREHDAERLIGG